MKQYLIREPSDSQILDNVGSTRRRKIKMRPEEPKEEREEERKEKRKSKEDRDLWGGDRDGTQYFFFI